MKNNRTYGVLGSSILLAMIVGIVSIAGCSTAPKAEDQATFISDANSALAWFENHVPGLRSQIDSAAAYIIYPSIEMEIDYNVGRILDAIKNAGIAENTILILTGDNGTANYPSPGLVAGEVGGSNGPWRGGLSTAYEGGMRTPAMVRWPGHIPAGKVSDEIVADLDWYPTIANLIGERKRIPTDRPIDGIDQREFLLG